MWEWLGKAIGKWTVKAIGGVAGAALTLLGVLITTDPEFGKGLRCKFFPEDRVICPPVKTADTGNSSYKQPPPDAPAKIPDAPKEQISPLPTVSPPQAAAPPPVAAPPETAPPPPVIPQSSPIPRPVPTPSKKMASPGSPLLSTQSEPCAVHGYIIEQPVLVKKGSRICATDGKTRATVTDVTSWTITYVLSEGGAYTCRKADHCSFGNEGPAFSIGVVESNQATGERTARLVRH